MNSFAKVYSLQRDTVSNDDLTPTKDLHDSTELSLKEENQQLRRQLKTFMHNVRVNEEKLRRLQDLEIRLIHASSLDDFFNITLNDYRNTAQLDEVTLVLMDPSFELRKILMEERLDGRYQSRLRFVDRRNELEEQFQIPTKPYVGPFHAERHRQLYQAKDKELASIAILPLYQQHKLVGSLNLASSHGERFIAGTAADLLQRFSQILTACLGNVINSERLKRLGLTDPLTGLNNRRFFDQRLYEEVGQSQRNSQPLCCLFFDVDHFKRVNDKFGHEAGDIVLKEVASIIRMNLRTADVLSRYGGEEFAALLLQSNESKAREIGERIRRSVESTQFNLTENTNLRVSISIGIAIIDKLPRNFNTMTTEELASDLVNRADYYLYQAKKTGRNKVVCGDLFSPMEPTQSKPKKEKGDTEKQRRLF
ncbi:MAG: sensor domain-containing diguanylate cyclase [Gammaproteobacteria bacterium]|nr:sensor domain-containing diguanylate cyclase [Gammaproteobacteria bacterium]